MPYFDRRSRVGFSLIAIHSSWMGVSHLKTSVPPLKSGGLPREVRIAPGDPGDPHGSASGSTSPTNEGLLLHEFPEGIDNFMMHLLVHDVDAWWSHVQDHGIVAKYGVMIEPL